MTMTTHNKSVPASIPVKKSEQKGESLPVSVAPGLDSGARVLGFADQRAGWEAPRLARLGNVDDKTFAEIGMSLRPE